MKFEDVKAHLINVDTTLEKTANLPETEKQAAIKELAYQNKNVINELFGDKNFTLPPQSPFTKESLLNALHECERTLNIMLPRPSTPRHS